MPLISPGIFASITAGTQMSLSPLKMVVGPLPPAASPNGSKGKDPTLLKRALPLPPLQVRKEVQILQPIETVTTISRRDMALCLTAATTLAGENLFKPEPAEARVKKPEIRKKIMEKLEQLREKAGLSKQTPGNGENTTPPPAPLVKEKGKVLPLPPLPNLQKSADQSLVEATLPH